MNKERIRKEASTYAGNWMHFKSFVWWARDEKKSPENWAIIETHHRDSPLKLRVNFTALQERLSRHMGGDDPDVETFEASHWAVGWTKGFQIRVYRDGSAGEITDGFAAFCRAMEVIENRGVLDMRLYAKELEAAKLKNIEFAARHCLPTNFELIDTLPKQWGLRVLEELDSQDCHWDDRIDTEGVPDPDVNDLVKALLSLAYAVRVP